MADSPIRKLLGIANWWRPTAKSDFDSLSIVAQRFVQAFVDHGVEAAQIPRLLVQVTLDDLQSPSKLLAALTPEVLDKTAQLFGIRVQWLEGVDDEIYDYQAVYKHPATLLEHLGKVRATRAETLDSPLRVLTTHMHLERTDQRHQLLAPVLVERIAELGEQDICRYRVYRDGFDWSYPPTRIELKAIAHVIFTTLHTPIPLFVVSKKHMDDLLEGKMIPRRFLEGCQITNPSLEDYALPLDYSRVAKEVDELPEVYEYISKHRLLDICLDGINPLALEQETSPTDEPIRPVPIEAPKPSSKPGKRQASSDGWAETRAYTKGLWSEDPSISIADMVRRIKSTKAMKASPYTESAIRKRIADLAPVGIRGKPGRKPNKSP
jgi:hypothetical protein